MDNSTVNKLQADTHQLTGEQQSMIDGIKQFAIAHIHDSKPAVYVIYGDAGTGKSVILSQLFYDFQQMSADSHGPLAGTKNYFLVNHPEILKVYKQIAGHEARVLKKNFNRPTSFINQMAKADGHSDITLIDEAHLLLSKRDAYNKFRQDNQLAEIIKRSQITILVFDHRQVLRTKSFWTVDRLKQLIAPYTVGEYHLKHQFRMNASDGLVKWINTFTDGKLTPFPADIGKNYDFRLFDDAEEMRKQIVKRNQEVGLSRIVSTTGYPSTLDGGKHYVVEGDFKLPWDQYNYTQTPWSELPSTINEVGSMYTCQGFDLNYVGVILGPPIKLDDDDNVYVDLSKLTDPESLKKRKDITDPKEFEQIKQTLVLNSVNVLMKRGVKGLYLFVHDPKLRVRLNQLWQQHQDA
ncbi:DUF2075 domain-containing protein [Nicoliella spurrieriana]|uniref:DUF2075 domain-containing protein n=1 Tax=Nicoliella spurrieriana TaxID=2925830 RepID=A0A976X5W8_9LACO|nr:DUF2075 domain-containing protein [Nicoliella spurrieriana]UQS87418.1 DUF2075 domain-containing protein [Nicoliella spurrieriana]